ncbi:hypothetical protein [Streptomyces sp. NPDC048392]
MLQLADVSERVFEVDAAERTADGQIVLERSDQHGRRERGRYS